MQRWSAFHQRAPRKSVSVGAVVRKDDAILFVRQTYGALRGQWSFPTGFAEPAESPETTALRETREEAGISAELDGLFALCSVDWEGDVQIYLVFLCHHLACEPTPDGIENDRASYIAMQELESWQEPVEPLCAWLAQRVFQHHDQLLRSVCLSAVAPHYRTAFT